MALQAEFLLHPIGKMYHSMLLFHNMLKKVSLSSKIMCHLGIELASILLLDGNLVEFGYLFELAEGLRSNLHGDLIAAVIPGVICIGSVLFLHVGVGIATMISLAGFGIGITNCMAPLLAAGKENKQLPG